MGALNGERDGLPLPVLFYHCKLCSVDAVCGLLD